MSPTGVALAVAVLRDAYPRADFPDRTVALYASMLNDLDDAATMAAVRRLVRRSTFLPSVAEIRREVAEAQLGLPTPEEAAESVFRDGGPGSLHPRVRESLMAIGGPWAVRTSETPGILRSQFVKDYAARRETLLLEAMGARALPPAEPLALPPTTQMRPRPIAERYFARMRGERLGPPSEREKADAIRILKVGHADVLYVEAERLLDEYGR
jgi:hypothetical protein